MGREGGGGEAASVVKKEAVKRGSRLTDVGGELHWERRWQDTMSRSCVALSHLGGGRMKCCLLCTKTFFFLCL